MRFFLFGLFCIAGGCQEEKEQNKTELNRLSLNSKISEFLHNLDHIPLEEEASSKEMVMDNLEENMKEEEEIPFFLSTERKKEEEKERLSLRMGEERHQRYMFLHQRETASVWKRKRSGVVRKEISFQDSNYTSRLKGIGEDISTFPVKGERVITADRYISVILENAINSQLPGRFIAIVDAHVFANEGRNILLPKGTRLICSYKSLAKEGDTRLGAVCGRAIRPDGVSLLLTGAYVADQMARTGLIGKVDNRIWEKYGSSFIVAGISALAGAGADTSETSIVRQSASNLSVNLGNITTGLLNEHIDLAPIVSVAAGSRLQIIPMTDIWLRSPEEREVSIVEEEK